MEDAKLKMQQQQLFEHSVQWNGRQWEQIVRPYGLARLIARLRGELLDAVGKNRAKIETQLKAAYKLQARVRP